MEAEDASSATGSVPWSARDPSHWPPPAPSQDTQDPNDEFDEYMRQAVEDSPAQVAKEQAPEATMPPTSQVPPPSSGSTTRRAQTVSTGPSFNSPWMIEDKSALAYRFESLYNYASTGTNSSNRPPVAEDEIRSSRIFETYKLHAVNFELTEGDTIVFVDYPNPPARPASSLDCYGTAYSSRQFRVHSEKLLATGSSVFKDLLGPTRQFRVLRRRKLVNQLPEGVKYVLDLTPPSEGDELVQQMMELSLTPGIIKWWMADQQHGVDSCLINGHDDVCSCLREMAGTSTLEAAEEPVMTGDIAGQERERLRQVKKKNPPTPEMLMLLKETGQRFDYEIPHYRQIPDYCPFRHCNSIVRLLMLIEGHNVSFDSATRVWTMLGIAKVLDCPMVLRDKVTQWIMYSVNTRFIEVHPEEALRIGFALELPDITASAFRILVNELALDLTDTRATILRPKPGVTVFGRRRGEVGDELQNLIQHAARALCDRVETTLKPLEEGCVYESIDVPEWKRLTELDESLSNHPHERAPAVQAKLRDLMNILNRDFKTRVRVISTGAQTHHEAAYASIDKDRASYMEVEDYEHVHKIMNGLLTTQRRLCAFFYHDLMYLSDSLLSASTITGFGDGPGLQAGELVVQLTVELEEIEREEPGYLPAAMTQVHPIACQSFMAVHLYTLRREAETALKPISSWWHRHNIDPPLNITRHLLLTLGPNELKYLPLWAGGDDDGTGGVFESPVPSAEMGPNGPGPAFHTGMTIPSAASSVSGSLMEEIRNMNVKGSTTAGSVDVHDSISTVYRPDKVIADDKSIATESFTASNSGAYSEARFYSPADHQPAGKAVEMLVDDGSTDRGSVVNGSTSEKPVKNLTADDWEIDDGSDDGSDTLSDSSMVML